MISDRTFGALKILNKLRVSFVHYKREFPDEDDIISRMDRDTRLKLTKGEAESLVKTLTSDERRMAEGFRRINMALMARRKYSPARTDFMCAVAAIIDTLDKIIEKQEDDHRAANLAKSASSAPYKRRQS